MGRHARPTRGGNLLSMRSKKQTERQLLLMESSLAYPRGKEKKSNKLKGREKNGRRQDTRVPRSRESLSEEDVPLRGFGILDRLDSFLNLAGVIEV
ncbi:hypothetical protein AVEN_90611-1 [Araneus ventricosus]|uniref:Uncharacterized protein n=1 Tax=Araneus ventricosus TaxID=182803 RepID=A0A4Y2C1K1_ARAVE|nr:hypothetical protein AVEN_90611-1 [Araneus ventricosus]